MIETLRSYIDNKEFYILVTKQFIYIKNYTNITSITNEEILFSINKNYYKISGNNLSLKRSENKELIISGTLESINKYD